MKYKYTVNGKTYFYDLITFASAPTDIRYAEGIVEKYIPGESVLVYFEPNNPQYSVLIPGKGTGMLLHLGLAFFLTGVFLLLFAKKKYIKKNTWKAWGTHL